MTRHATDATAHDAPEMIELRARLEAAEARIADKDAVIDDLRRRLDAEAEERRRLTAILTDQRAAVPDSVLRPSPWWRRRFGWRH